MCCQVGNVGHSEVDTTIRLNTRVSTSSISVVVPTYNRGAAIEPTLNSVLAQTTPVLEILVVDDGSTDGTGDWVKDHYAHEPRVRVISQSNGGVAAARNRGLEAVRGEFVAFLDHDDRWHPDKLRLQLELMQQRPEVGVVYSLWQQVSEDGEIIPGHEARQVEADWNLPEGEIFFTLIKRNFLISMSVPLVRTALVREVGGFDPATVPCDDYDLWLRLSRKTQFAYVREVLVFYQYHQNQQSRDEVKMWHATRSAQIKHWKSVLHRPKALWFMLAYGYFLRTIDPYYFRARYAIAASRWQEVLRQVVRCCLRHPLALLTPQWIYVLMRWATKDARPF